MLGDRHQHFVTARTCGVLAARLGDLQRPALFSQIRNQSVCPLLARRSSEVWAGVPLRWEVGSGDRLSRWLLARSDASECGIRHCTGELMKPHRVSREAISLRLWRWRAQMSWRWCRGDAHINELEASAVLVQLKVRSRSSGNFNIVSLRLVDSQVARGVFVKR